MKHPYLRFASITALATITAAACVYEAGFARADDGATVGDRPTVELHTGDPFLIPTGVIHDAVNVGDVRTMMLSTYVIPLGQPLVAPH